ncbi:hypothetical protein Z949_3423 [Sulfitobacter guttiformis KCTC 32187]|nr:hypothetical protein Z949_3423 [Sulfitobacter guttiformis KCTC 32187]
MSSRDYEAWKEPPFLVADGAQPRALIIAGPEHSLEAGKHQLSGDTARQAALPEVKMLSDVSLR